ncbi:unnamed protein product [Paramecium primaurelia]|uniref:Uncharacterized protein n=1 Tax=Paramecium primaurelia TaxID=5886 RepID=A0A8S1QPL6_PARPR|nr:unnamed protein product [Paramecium primaurelia]
MEQQAICYKLCQQIDLTYKSRFSQDQLIEKRIKLNLQFQVQFKQSELTDNINQMVTQDQILMIKGREDIVSINFLMLKTQRYIERPQSQKQIRATMQMESYQIFILPRRIITVLGLFKIQQRQQDYQNCTNLSKKILKYLQKKEQYFYQNF